MSNHKISIIIPVYNDELYLYDTLKSVQQQKFTDFECICVNDGSTDKSEEIIDIFSKNDNRFLKINQKNGGVSSARNAGLNIAKGEYIYFLDHDDLIPDYALQKLFAVAEKFNADLSRGRKMTISEDFKLEELPKESTTKDELYFTNPLIDFYKIVRKQYGNFVHIWQCLFRHSAIKDIKFVEQLRNAGYEDNLFMLETIGRIKNFVQTDDIVVCHRYSKTSITLNGFNPAAIKVFEIAVPYVYEKYAIDKNIDKRLLKIVYSKTSYAFYRTLVRNAVNSNDDKHLDVAREVLLKLSGTPEFNELIKRLSFEKKCFLSLLARKKYTTLRKLRKFMW